MFAFAGSINVILNTILYVLDKMWSINIKDFYMLEHHSQITRTGA